MSLRNIAIIAHVDHGKTTLVDQLLKQSGSVRANQAMDERALDSNDLERERGITILAKATSVQWQDHQVNIVDTPGHADFGGEVERILSMVDGVVLLVDAAEGPMPQTKFVTGKALSLGLRPIVVVNKVDRPDARAEAVYEEVFDLFAALDAKEDQLDFPILYASGRDGWASDDPDGERKDLSPLFEVILAHVPEPEPVARASSDHPFRMLVTTIESDPFLGRIITGRIDSGVITPNQPVKVLDREGKPVEQGRVTKILAFRGLQRQPIDVGMAGDIVALSGLQKTTVAHTVGDLALAQALPAQPVDPPTLAMTFSINTSPLAGREGQKVQSRVVRTRLFQEAEGNVALKVTETEDKDSFEVAGRGELQLSVLIETMRREGFELSISRPRVLFREDPETGERQEPIEEVIIDVDEEFSGVVIEGLARRKGDLADMRTAAGGKTRLRFLCPSRGLIGYLGEFLTETRGTGVMARLFDSYAPYRGEIEGRHKGVLISMNDGDAVAYALWNLEDR
ncbi:MAG: translational GTPase TypA, partial [Pseudomonadota bacterium]